METTREIVELTDPRYFCNQSWTLSYNLNTGSWISFHSYIPNYYVAENNFFYSGKQDCCTEFDFVAGVLIPTPTTTTTTTVFVPICTPLTGIASAVTDICIPLTAEIILTDCVLIGEAEVTALPVCRRPEGVMYNSFIIGYTEGSDPYVDTSTDSAVTCATITYLNTLPGYEDIVFNYLNFESVDLSIGTTLYAANATTDCEVIPDGYYFNDESAASQTYYQVLDGIIVGIFTCAVTTTTTTTVPVCTSYTSVSSWTPVVIEWLDCDGIYHTETTPGGTSVYMFDFCASVILSSVGSTIISNGPCIP